MNKNIVIAFIAGSITGGFVTWKFIRKKYEDQYQKDLAEIKEMLALSDEADVDKTVPKPDSSQSLEKPSIDEYLKTMTDAGYVDYSTTFTKENDTSKVEEDKKVESRDVYVITPDEFGEVETYNKIELNYFADGVVADDDGQIITDIAGVLGDGALERFGEYEENALHVRNDRLKSYFEVLKDKRMYDEVFEDTVNYMEDYD